MQTGNVRTHCLERRFRRSQSPCPMLVASAFAQAHSPKTGPTRGLSIQYADGRVSTGPVRRTGGMWTGTFPRVAGSLNVIRARCHQRFRTTDGSRRSDWDERLGVSGFCDEPFQSATHVATIQSGSRESSGAPYQRSRGNRASHECRSRGATSERRDSGGPRPLRPVARNVDDAGIPHVAGSHDFRIRAMARIVRI